MEIKYDIIHEDVTNYSSESAKGSSPYYTVQVVLMVSLVLTFMMADMLMTILAIGLNDGSIRIYSFQLLPRMIVGFAIMGVFYVALRTISKRLARKAAATEGKNGAFCEHIITLRDNGFSDRTEVDNSFRFWEGVEKVTETKNYVTIHVRLCPAYVIPKRAFASAEQVQEFVSTVHNHILTAQPWLAESAEN